MDDNKNFDVGHLIPETVDDDKERSRCFMLLLYPDNPEMAEALRKIRQDLEWSFAGRIHDEEGKAHYHVVLTFKNDRKAYMIANDLGITTRWIRPWNNVVKAHRYLCHRDNPDKFQYSSAEIFGTDAELAQKRCDKDAKASDADDIRAIIKLLDDTPFYLKTAEALSLIAEANLWATFRRLGRFGEKLLDEHNAKYFDCRL